jgi:hypothetical protein
MPNNIDEKLDKLLELATITHTRLDMIMSDDGESGRLPRLESKVEEHHSFINKAKGILAIFGVIGMGTLKHIFFPEGK